MKLYIHVPFCRSKCAYCDFYSTPRLELMERYVDAVLNEWHERGGCVSEVNTLYLGGGTPSSLPSELLARLVEPFRPWLPSMREVTIEVNPDDVTPEHIIEWKRILQHPRVSMGVQSFDDGHLRLVGRRHSAAQAEQAFAMLREGGIDNISCDLIYGLPGQTLASWEQSVERMLELRPEHISAYLLSYEPGTRLSAMLMAGKVEEASDELAQAMYDTLCHRLREAGYVHYEISNFALAGREAVHNSSYWDGSEYIGLGPGAHSFVGGIRGYNPSNLREYVACEGRGFYVEENENDLERLNDRIITSLRTLRGLDYTSIDCPPLRADIDRLLRQGSLCLTPSGRVIIPESLWLTSDTILRQLIQV